jgi:hypothetical protein
MDVLVVVCACVVDRMWERNTLDHLGYCNFCTPLILFCFLICIVCTLLAVVYYGKQNCIIPQAETVTYTNSGCTVMIFQYEVQETGIIRLIQMYPVSKHISYFICKRQK